MLKFFNFSDKIPGFWKIKDFYLSASITFEFLTRMIKSLKKTVPKSQLFINHNARG